jgi:hypothetical protein
MQKEYRQELLVNDTLTRSGQQNVDGRPICQESEVVGDGEEEEEQEEQKR